MRRLRPLFNVEYPFGLRVHCTYTTPRPRCTIAFLVIIRHRVLPITFVFIVISAIFLYSWVEQGHKIDLFSEKK